MGIVVFVDVADASFDQGVVDAGVGQFCDRWVLFYFIEITQQIAAPRSRLMLVAVFLDQFFKFLIMVHSNSLPFSYR